jgi:glycerophosphoryl diester phosphodiesterase
MKKVCSRMNVAWSQLQVKPALRQKLVLHRGWHSLGGDVRRPLENTRQAYLDASKLGVAFAECDVWSTKDSELVLCHDPSFERVAQDPECEVARAHISELTWKELRSLPLQDGSTPVRLTTVLSDLIATQTRLVIEMSSSGPAAPLAELLNRRRDLLPAVAWVMSFSIRSLKLFSDHGAPEEVRKGWLLDNPRIPYEATSLKEGETTFDYTRETLQTFLGRTGLTEVVQRMKCFLYLQYHPSLTTPQLSEIREELRNVLGETSTADVACAEGLRKCALGLWSDIDLDPNMDTEIVFDDLIDAVDFINSDMPDTFWNAAQVL